MHFDMMELGGFQALGVRITQSCKPGNEQRFRHNSAALPIPLSTRTLYTSCTCIHQYVSVYTVGLLSVYVCVSHTHNVTYGVMRIAHHSSTKPTASGSTTTLHYSLTRDIHVGLPHETIQRCSVLLSSAAAEGVRLRNIYVAKNLSCEGALQRPEGPNSPENAPQMSFRSRSWILFGLWYSMATLNSWGRLLPECPLAILCLF